VNKPRIVIMAGGTGGHVFPALAVARYLINNGWEVHWLGTKRGMESRLVPNAGIPIHYVSVQGLRKTGLWSLFLAPIQLFLALCQSLKIIFSLKPKVVVGMGGFVSGPGGVAAWLLRRPLLIHEQNSIAGMTNRLLAMIADKVLEAFPESFPTQVKTICTGNPVREELLQLPAPAIRFQGREGPLRLLVLGGSQGARALNELCPLALLGIPAEKQPVVWHQTGIQSVEKTRQAYQNLGLTAKVEPFIEDMAAAYAWADLVLCRAGALTIAELAAVGIGSILVPYPFAVDDHQTHNGHFLERVGSATVIQQKVLSAQTLAEMLLEFSADQSRLLQMAEAAYSLAKRDALVQVANYCEEIGSHANKKT